MFKLRPYRGLLLLAAFVLIIGSLCATYFFIEDAYSGNRRWLFLLIASLILGLLLVVAAYSRYGFKHLWHHRPGYKRG